MAKSISADCDPRLAAVQKIVLSRAFNKSPRLTSFLTYVCERAVEGSFDSINEQLVGVHVFGKAPGYSPADDSIVRSAARQLRQRLALYYQEEGREDAIRITLPRGGYVPHFDSGTALEPPPEPFVGPEPERVVSRRRWPILTGTLLILFVSAGFAVKLWRTNSSYDAFWDLLLPKGTTTLLVPCDSTLVMVQNVTKKMTHLDGYFSAGQEAATVLPPSDSFLENNFSARKYTTIADVRLAAYLGQLGALKSSNVEIRFGRDLRAEDLKQRNVILVGGPQGNPWIELFAKQANFSIETDDRTYVQTVINRAPHAGEQPRYVVRHDIKNQSVYPIYGIVSFRPNLEHSGYVLAISGTSMAGIDAASTFLFTRSQFEPFLRDARLPNGKFPPFEVLLAATSVSQSAVDLHIAARRFGE